MKEDAEDDIAKYDGLLVFVCPFLIIYIVRRRVFKEARLSVSILTCIRVNITHYWAIVGWENNN